MKFIKIIISFFLLTFSSFASTAPKVVATNMALHSIVSYILKGIDKPIFLDKTIDSKEQVSLIDANLLFYDSRFENVNMYIKLYFSGKDQKANDLKEMPGVESANFMYWPQNAKGLSFTITNIIKNEFPEYIDEITHNHNSFLGELSMYGGEATRREFNTYIETQQLLDVEPYERYFIILRGLGLKMKG